MKSAAKAETQLKLWKLKSSPLLMGLANWPVVVAL
jgi:hypothetical protein